MRSRVVQLVLGLEVGGLEFVVLNLVRYADRTRFDHRVLCLERVGALAPRFEAVGVPVESLAGGGRLGTVLRLARRLRSAKADVLHTHNPKPHAVGSLARRLAGVPVLVHTKHGRNHPHVARAVRTNRWASRWSDAVVAVSEDAARVALEVERVPGGKLSVIYNGVDLAGWPPERAPEGPPRAVCVARLHPVKDHATLLRGVQLVLAERPDFHLDIVGDGPERGNLEGLRRELGLEGAVTLHGHQDDVRPHLLRATLFVLASLSEGISLTLLEAMAASLPIVATDVGGNREIVAAGETGLLVPAGSPESLARAILEVVEDPAGARALGRAGRHRAEVSFDVRKMVSGYENLYAKLSQRKGVSGD
jgi:glycosyltransferase involved in cell wall biosynthesis